MGVQVRGPKDSWLRFAVLEVPFSSVPLWAVDEYLDWTARSKEDKDLAEFLPLDWG